MVLNKLAGHPDSFRKRKEYKMGEVIGEGTFGIVRHAFWSKRDPPIDVAVKVIAKRLLKDNVDLADQELQVLMQCNHPNIVKLYDDFESKDKFYMVMEQATGGDMFDRMIRRGTLTEAHAARVVRSITSAVAYLHDRHIVHRDIKPENILYRTKAEDSEVVLVDFGVAQALSKKGELMSSLAGSYGYVAPEVLGESEYGVEVDMWSVGVVTYVMISGYTPFKGSTPKELREEILKHAAGFDDKYWSKVSPDARDFVLSCLSIDYNKRLTAKQALEHPWLTATHDDSTNIIAGLRDNFGRDKLRRPPMPRRTTHLVHVERRGCDRHELESSDEESDIGEEDEEAEESANAVPPVSPAAPTMASARPSNISSARPSTAGSQGASPSIAASTAPTSTAPSLDIKRKPSTARKPSVSEPNRIMPALAPTNNDTPTAPTGILGGLKGLLTGDNKERRASQSQRGNDSTTGRRKSRFSFLRLSRSGSRTSQNGPRPVVGNNVHSASELDEATFDDDEEGEARPFRNTSSPSAPVLLNGGPVAKAAPSTLASNGQPPDLATVAEHVPTWRHT